MCLVKIFLPFQQLEQLVVNRNYLLSQLENRFNCVPNYTIQIDAIEPVVIDPVLYIRYFRDEKEWLVAGYNPDDDDFLVFSIDGDLGNWSYMPSTYFSTTLGHLAMLDFSWQPTKLSRHLDRKGLMLINNDELVKIPEENLS